jgi:hypothetical protein
MTDAMASSQMRSLSASSKGRGLVLMPMTSSPLPGKR